MPVIEDITAINPYGATIMVAVPDIMKVVTTIHVEMPGAMNVVAVGKNMVVVVGIMNVAGNGMVVIMIVTNGRK
jgi:hypothetical protein